MQGSLGPAPTNYPASRVRNFTLEITVLIYSVNDTYNE